MLDYKAILTKHYVLCLSGSEIAKSLGSSKSGVNDFLTRFARCEELSIPLPEGITNIGIASVIYGKIPGEGGRDTSYEYPDFTEVSAKLKKRNMTLQICWNRYYKACQLQDLKPYQYRQFCDLFRK